jgi:hypothetical protein
MYAGDIFNVHHVGAYEEGSSAVPLNLASDLDAWLRLLPTGREYPSLAIAKGAVQGTLVPNFKHLWPADDGSTPSSCSGTCTDCTSETTLCAQFSPHFEYGTPDYVGRLYKAYTGVSVPGLSVRADIHEEPSGNRVACTDIQFEFDADNKPVAAAMEFYSDASIAVRVGNNHVNVTALRTRQATSAVHLHWVRLAVQESQLAVAAPSPPSVSAPHAEVATQPMSGTTIVFIALGVCAVAAIATVTVCVVKRKGIKRTIK